jgi:hypothetical protein
MIMNTCEISKPMNVILVFACCAVLSSNAFKREWVAGSFVLFASETYSQPLDPLSAAIGPMGLASMGRIGQLAPISYAMNPAAPIQAAMQGMVNLPPPLPDPIELIDPNLLSEVRISLLFPIIR